MRYSAFLIFFYANASCAAAGAQADSDSIGYERVNPNAIAAAVDEELIDDPHIPYDDIIVQVDEGIVTLEGKANHLLAKRRATLLAGSVRGVRAVVNQIDVNPHWERSDAAIERDVEDALLYDRATESTELEVHVTMGRVQLSGSVDSWAERDLAERAAMGVSGVRAVDNDIDIAPPKSRPSYDIRKDVEARLAWDALVDARYIDVQVDGEGGVTLQGTVGSATERWQALADAWVTGVKTVDMKQLTVSSVRDDKALRKLEAPIVSDTAVQRAIHDAFQHSPEVDQSEISIHVNTSRVTLRGFVPTLAHKRAAARVSRNTVGVHSVKNRIRVRPLEARDQSIEREIERAVARNPKLERLEIDVDVMDGTVTLSGSVASYYEKGLADLTASKANGVVEVENELDVRHPRPMVYDPYVSDAYPYEFYWYDYEPDRPFIADRTIRDEIESELYWSPYVDADAVRVHVQNGVARLEGTVPSRFAANAAVENAFEGGATWVEDDLEISNSR